MSGVTLAQAQAQLSALLEAQSSNMLSVNIAGRTVQYRTAKDLIEAINYWERRVVSLQRTAAGGSRHGTSAASFRSSQ